MIAPRLGIAQGASKAGATWLAHVSNEMEHDLPPLKTLQIDALEFLVEQGAAPFEQLRREAAGASRTKPLASEGDFGPLGASEWSALTRHYLGAGLEPGHDIAALQSGYQSLLTMLESIRSATQSIEFLSFDCSKGSVAERFCEALIERAQDGVDVRVVLDALGGRALGDALISKMRDSRVELLFYRPNSSWKFWRKTRRNHLKMLIVDSRVGYTGSGDISTKLASNCNHAGGFRDTQLRITGPTLGQLKAAFVEKWASAGGRLPDPLDRVPVQSSHAREIPAAVIPTSTASGRSRAALMFQLLVRGSSQSLQVVTPFFVPGTSLLRELQQASKRGVDVCILVCGKHNDHWLPRWAGQSCYEALLESGVDVEETDLTLMRSKLVIVDERLTMFGSPNVTQRSRSLNEGIGVICHDRKLARQLLDEIDAERAHSRCIDPRSWNQRSLIMRLREAFASTFTPQL